MPKPRNGQQQSQGNQQVRRSPRLNQSKEKSTTAVDQGGSPSSSSKGGKGGIDVEMKEESPTKRPDIDNKTCLAYEQRCTEHKWPESLLRDHPERPERIQRIYEKLTEEGLVDRCVAVKSRMATIEEVTLVHDAAYVREFESTQRMDADELRQWQQRWNSIYACPRTWDAAMLACGNLLECVDAVVDGRATNGAAVIRPPGHHAEPDGAYGFCFVNNVAVAAKYAQKMLGVGKVLILDWDVHHGNGIQSAFYTDPTVLYMSLHRYDHGRFFPCDNGNQYNYTDVGDGAGRGFNINIPWDGRGIGDGEYLEAFKKVIMPIANEFKPELVLVSAGFDAARGDPLGGYRVTPHGYARMTRMLSTLANGRIVLALEGGYNLTSISDSMAACVRVLLGEHPVEPDDGDEEPKPCSTAAKSKLVKIESFLGEFWKCMGGGGTEERPEPEERMDAAAIQSAVASADETVQAIKKLSMEIEEQLQISVSCSSESENASSSSTTGLLFEEEVSSKHFCPWDPNHIETPARLTTSLRKIHERGLVERCLRLSPRRADVSEICYYHDMALVETLSETPNWNETKLESLSSKFDDVYVNEHTYESALIAAGSTVDAVRAILDGKCANAMVLVRPPGHHAMKADINGFCIFNNVVIAAKMALELAGLKRVLIVDWDVHHGQGTQRAFYDDPRVLYFSIHRYENGTFWPNLRESHWDHVGTGDGEGFNVNVPLNRIGMGDAEYLAIFDHLLAPLAVEFDPELILVSAGYDAAVGCPEGRMQVSPLCYAHLTRMLRSVANNGRVCVVLEGGYCLDSLAEGVAMTLRALLGDYCPRLPVPKRKPIDPSVVEVILNLAHRLGSKWSSMRALAAAVDGTLMKMGRASYEQSEPLFNWTPPTVVTPTVYATKNKYAFRPPETIEHFRRVVEEIMRGCEPLERTKFTMTMGGVDRGQLAIENDGQCRVLDGQKLANELLLVRGHGYLDQLKTSLVGGANVRSDPARTQGDFDEAVGTFEICLNTLEAMGRRESQCGLVVISEKSILDPIVELTRFAQGKLGLKRVLIIDIHHGHCREQNARKFYEDSSVLYVTLHRNDAWSASDHTQPENIGRGSGAGYNVNLVWNGKTASDADDLFALHHIIMPLAYSFDPDLVLLYSEFTEVGADGASASSSSGSAAYVSATSLSYFAHQLQSLAEGKLLVLLKGDGSNATFAARVKSCAAALVSGKLPSELRLDRSNAVADLSQKTILSYMETVFYLRPYWPYLQCVLAPNKRDRSTSMEAAMAAATSVEEYLGIQQQLGNINAVYVGFPSATCPHTQGHGVCTRIPTASEISMTAPCDLCGNVGENWICLTCWQVHCSRYVNEHAVIHSQQSGHPIALSMADLSVWCYVCETYIRSEVVMPAKRVLHLVKFGVEMPS